MLSVMSADLLRRAAEKIRSRSALATRELDGDPWDITDPGEASDIENHIALWSPDVAELVAEFLEESAVDFDDPEMSRLLGGCDCPSCKSAVKIARRILGEDA